MAQNLLTVPENWPDPKGKEYPYLKNIPWTTGDRFLVEKAMLRRGWDTKHPDGMGTAHHFKAAMSALWPHFSWFMWPHLIVDHVTTNSETAILGPASSGKTYTNAALALSLLWVWPKDTTVMASTTSVDALDYRIWGSMMELYREAKSRRPYLEGRPASSKHRLLTGDAEDDEMPPDKRDGILGIACRIGNQWVGIQNYVGLKNERVFLIADEAHLMGAGFLDSLANMRKNPSFRCCVCGNPKDPYDPLGKSAEPRREDNGWNGYVAEKRTKVWRTDAGGVAIQLCGLDSPNFKYGRGLNPYRNIITPEQIENDVRQYGEDSLQVSMMNYGIMPKSGSTRRVLDVMLCRLHRAFETPVWEAENKLTHVGSCDAAYSGVGGDRCVFTEMVFGPDLSGNVLLAFRNKQEIIPINPSLDMSPEDQIAQWVMLACRERGIPPENFGYDSTGRGTLGVAIARIWSSAILPIEFGGYPSKDRPVSAADHRMEIDVYGKKVTALWYASRLTVESNQFRNVPMDAVEEAQMREWTIVKSRAAGGNPLIDVEPKDKMKKRIARSPDLWDSACIALEVARIRGFTIAGGYKVGIEKRQMPQWLRDRSENMRRLRERNTLLAVR